MSSDNKNVPIDYNVKEIIDNLDKKKILTPEDKKRIEESLTICKLLFKSRKYVELIKYCDELLEKYSENGVCKIL